MPAGFPVKADYASGDVLTAAQMNDLSATLNYLDPTAKGDLFPASSGTDLTRLAVGANDTVLTADSSTTTGLKWAAAASGGGMTLISETVASAVTGVDFTGIPATYKQLMLVWSGIIHSATGSFFSIRFNANSGSIYDTDHVNFQNTTVTHNQNARNAIDDGNNSFPFGISVDDTTLEKQAQGILLIDNYASSTKVKTFECQWSFTGAGLGAVRNITLGAFDTTTAITQVNVVRKGGTATFSNSTNTSIRLYGIS